MSGERRKGRTSGEVLEARDLAKVAYDGRPATAADLGLRREAARKGGNRNPKNPLHKPDPLGNLGCCT